MASADELILQMQHLAAQARAMRTVAAARDGLDRLKSSAQKLAAQKQLEIDQLDAAVTGADERLAVIKQNGVTGDEAKEYVALSDLIAKAQKQLVKSRAQLEFALERMEAVERREYEAFHAEVRAEHHGQLAADPLHQR